MENFLPSVIISFLALAVIFLVLSILILLIKILNHLWPYQAPAAPPPSIGSASTEEAEHVAVIHSVLARHLGRSPETLQVTRIEPL